MKTTFFLSILMLSGLLCFSQEETSEEMTEALQNNEIRVNAAYLIAGLPEISCERILSEESAVGVSLGFSIDDDIDYKFFLTPFYRFYFGKKRAAGFFVEANGNVYSEEGDQLGKNEMGLGLGLAVGGKFMTKSGWVAELLAEAGRNFINTETIDEAYPRLGISIGKRF